MDSIKPTTRVARGATYMFIQGFTNSALGLIYFVVLARILSQAEMGIFALLYFIVSLPQVIGLFALPQAAIKYIPQYITEGKYDKAKSVVIRILRLSTLVSVVSFLLIFVPAEWVSIQLFNNPDYVLHLRLLALASVFNIMYIAVGGFLQGLQKIRDYAVIGLIYTFFQNFVGIFLLSIGWGLYGVVYSWLVGLAIASIAGLIMTVRELGVVGKPHELKPLLKFSLPLYASSLVTYFINWVDQLILVSYMSLLYGAIEAQRTLGIYYVAVRAAGVPTLFSTSIIIAVFPQLSALYTKQGASSLKEAFYVSSRYCVLIGFPLIVGIAVLAYPIIILFAGFEYAEATLPLMIISIFTLVSTLGISVAPILMTLERTMLVSALALINVILSVVFSIFTLAVLLLGMVGTAWARTIAGIISIGLSIYVLNRYIKISFDKEALWKGSAASVFMVLIIIAIDVFRGCVSPHSYQFLVFRLQLLPLYVAIGGLAYFCALILLRAIKKQDIELLKEYLPKDFRKIASLLQRIARVE